MTCAIRTGCAISLASFTPAEQINELVRLTFTDVVSWVQIETVVDALSAGASYVLTNLAIRRDAERTRIVTRVVFTTTTGNFSNAFGCGSTIW